MLLQLQRSTLFPYTTLFRSMTDKINADHVYLKPLEKKSIREILEKHHIDAVLPTMGGQTALNLCIDCEKAGIWQDRKSTRLNSSHPSISYAVFCLKKKKKHN